MPAPGTPATARPDTIVDTDPDTLSRIVGVDRALAKAISDGLLTITGNRQAGQHLFDAAVRTRR